MTNTNALLRLSSFALTAALLASAAGCKKNANTVNGVDANDPAMANMAAAPANGAQPLPSKPAAGQPYYASNGQPVRVMGQSDQGAYNGQATSYGPDAQYSPTDYEDQGNPEYGQMEATQAPPPLPNYSQPPLTRPNSIWTPGYWAYNQRGYYWVPGAWVAAPYQGALWTPGYWQNASGRYRFHPGYWGRHVGFYGGIAYGNGYPGRGFYGGYWNGPNFYYNQAVSNVNSSYVQFVYARPEPALPAVRVSFNGPGGVALVPVDAEYYAMRERHRHPVRMQYESWRSAGADPAQFWSALGHIGIYATNNVYAPEAYYAPAPVVVEHRYYERPGPAVYGGFPGAPEWHEHHDHDEGHWDNGWHGHRGEGERGEWHDHGHGHDRD